MALWPTYALATTDFTLGKPHRTIIAPGLKTEALGHAFALLPATTLLYGTSQHTAGFLWT